MKPQNPFYRSEKPESGYELFKWFIFEPNRLEKFEGSLSIKKRFIWFIRTYPYIIILCIILYLLFSAIIVCFDLPIYFPNEFKPEIAKQWNQNFFSNYQICIIFSYKNLARGLTGGLVFGLVFGLAGDLAVGLAGGLAVGLASGLALGLTEGLASGLASGLAFGLAGGLTRVLAGGLVFSLARGLSFGLSFGLVFSLARGLSFGLTFGLTGCLSLSIILYLFYFRLIFYPFYLFRSLFPITLTKNPYINDAVIWLPIPTVNNRLLNHARQDPELGFQFADFLLEYRPLQKELAFRITHTANAATWFYHPLQAEKLITPMIYETKFNPSSEWLNLIQNIKNNLIAAEKHNNIWQKKYAWQIFHNSLKDLEKLTLIQSDIWKADYLKAIREWIKESEKTLEKIRKELPPFFNPYRPNEFLEPQGFGKETFIGRNDIRDKLSSKILTSAVMPTFLLQGQRRVGKTSLINFLQELLGSRFVVIMQDCQGHFTLESLLNGFKEKAEHILKLEHSDKFFSDKPLTLWKSFEKFFTKLAEKEKRKIILAFDEYEEFHNMLKKEDENREQILKAMRSFSQHQNNIVFLFTGLYLFTDLFSISGEPDFSKYFVHAQRVKVDYLAKEPCIQLIIKPYPEFRLIYPDELTEEIYYLTCGHPALLQHICFELVNLANRKMKKDMTDEDLHEVLSDKILDRSNAVMITFWVHFCNPGMKQTVREILNHQQITNRANLAKLLDYGFIIQDKEFYKLRVPLFEQWILKHGDSFE